MFRIKSKYWGQPYFVPNSKPITLSQNISQEVIKELLDKYSIHNLVEEIEEPTPFEPIQDKRVIETEVEPVLPTEAEHHSKKKRGRKPSKKQ